MEITVWKNKEQIKIDHTELLDPLIRPEVDKVKNMVLKKDRDWVAVVDGEEGVGKSVFAQQLALYLDPTFTIDDIVFSSDDFLKRIKDPKIPKGKAIVLDETYAAASARGSMSEVNKSLVGVATEMRQLNLFIIMVLPTFFDMDRYFALWRCKTLFHLYFNDREDRAYIVFPKNHKKNLYINGKKRYNYSKPRSPFPPLRFNHIYTVDEMAYRLKKSKAFQKRAVSMRAVGWMNQRNAFIKFIFKNITTDQEKIANVPAQYGAPPLDRTTLGKILNDLIENEGDG